VIKSFFIFLDKLYSKVCNLSNDINKRCFEREPIVNFKAFIELLVQMDLIDTFKDIFSQECGGFTGANRKIFRKKMCNDRDISPDQKKEVLYDQDNKCIICNKKTFYLIVDHILALFMGGSNERCNLQGLCPDCNSIKTRGENVAFKESVKLTYNLYFDKKQYITDEKTLSVIGCKDPNEVFKKDISTQVEFYKDTKSNTDDIDMSPLKNNISDKIKNISNISPQINPTNWNTTFVFYFLII